MGSSLSSSPPLYTGSFLSFVRHELPLPYRQVEQMNIVSGTRPVTAIVDLGFRGWEIEGA